jgi:hypothetical protein
MFDVMWAPSTVDELTEIWMQANQIDRERITRAVDRELKRRAPQTGESREADRRVYFESPSGILFRVSEEHQVAVVSRVWRFAE